MVKAVEPSRAVSIWKKNHRSLEFCTCFFPKNVGFFSFFMWMFVVPSLEFSHVVSHDTVDNGQSCTTSDGFFQHCNVHVYIYHINWSESCQSARLEILQVLS